jgi:predicted tellurium resistance membrane protein TerC/NAD(P)-dependent dehydrogenase (short-subunit alcohol dehydrogenase family)
MFDILTDANAWAALLTLSALEIVLGIDNLVFIAVLTSRLDAKRSRRARAIGLSLAFIFRVMLLASLSWIMGLTQPLFTVFEETFSWRDVILIAGGLFLLAKGTREIHGEVEGEEGDRATATVNHALSAVIIQLAVIDLVFSVDSIVTAVGLADQLEVMVAAIVIAMIVMFVAARPVGEFIEQYPTTKMLALAFLLMIGLALMADGFHFHIPRGYIYSAMAFAAIVEFLNVLARRRRRSRAGRLRTKDNRMPRPVLLVAGGSRGIGAATARLAGSRGYDVAGNYLSNRKSAASVVEAVKQAGGTSLALQGDMAKEADIQRVFEETAKELGPITHFVHSSGIIGKMSKFIDAPAEVLRDVIDVNLYGGMLCAREAVRRMSTERGGPGGSIVLLSSIAAVTGGVGEYVFYAAAKAGIDGLVVGLAREVAKEGIRVNAIRPGPTDTEIHEPGRLERISPMLPMGRAGKPDEIAEAVLFLLSDAASYISGTVLNVAGGR